MCVKNEEKDGINCAKSHKTGLLIYKDFSGIISLFENKKKVPIAHLNLTNKHEWNAYGVSLRLKTSPFFRFLRNELFKLRMHDKGCEMMADNDFGYFEVRTS